MVTEEELPYWHLEHEVLLAEAKANISNSAVEKAGGSEHQDQVEVSRKGSLEEGKEVPCHTEDAAYGGRFSRKQKLFNLSIVQHRPDSCMHTAQETTVRQSITARLMDSRFSHYTIYTHVLCCTSSLGR